MIIFNLFACNENFSLVCSNHAEISARFTLMKFLPIIVILLLLSLRMRDEISSWRFNDLKVQVVKFPGLRLSTKKSATKLELLAKIFSHVRKRLQFWCLTGFWMCLCYVHDNYLSVNFPTQPILLLSSLWWFRGFYFLTFPIFHKTHETRTPALPLATKSCWKDGWHLPIC